MLPDLDKWLSLQRMGMPNPKMPLMGIVPATTTRDPVPVQTTTWIHGGDLTFWSHIKSTLWLSPTDKTVALRGSMELRSALEIHLMTMAMRIPGKWAIYLILDSNFVITVIYVAIINYNCNRFLLLPLFF